METPDIPGKSHLKFGTKGLVTNVASPFSFIGNCQHIAGVLMKGGNSK